MYLICMHEGGGPECRGKHGDRVHSGVVLPVGHWQAPDIVLVSVCVCVCARSQPHLSWRQLYHVPRPVAIEERSISAFFSTLDASLNVFLDLPKWLVASHAFEEGLEARFVSKVRHEKWGGDLQQHLGPSATADAFTQPPTGALDHPHSPRGMHVSGHHLVAGAVSNDVQDHPRQTCTRPIDGP